MVNIKKCRICLKVKPNMRFLSSSELVDGKICTISDILKSCTSIQINLGDELPNMICQHCINRLYYCWSFKGDCEKSEATLQQKLNKRKREQNTNASTSNSREPIQNNTASTKQNKQINENVPFENFVQRTTILIDEKFDKLFAEAVNNDQINPTVKVRLQDEQPQATTSNKINVQQSENIIISSVSKMENQIDLTLNTTNENEPVVLKDITNDDNKNENKKQKLNTEAPHVCFICDNIFKTKELYNSHMNTHTNTDGYNCTICDEQFDVFAVLESHMKLHTGSHKCPQCMKYFESLIELNNHLKTHNKKDFVCDLCCKDYYSSNNLYHHTKEIHSGVNQYFCDVCMKGFTDKIPLENHRKIHVNNNSEILFPCDECGQVFTSYEVKESHSNNMHAIVQCEICLKKFKKNALIKHLLAHTNRRYFSCNYCYMVFSSMQEVRDHTTKIHYTCRQCSKTFKNTHFLNLHMKAHAKTCE